LKEYEDYDHALEKLSLKKGIVFLLGHSDSGKTTFSKRLASLALKNGRKASVVDSDVGQSTIGPPSCIGAQVFNTVEEADRFGKDFYKLYFVGSTSPRGNLLPMVTGTFLLSKKCLKKTDLVIIDTTGLVLGDYGQTLKYYKVSLISPRHLVLFEREEELRPYKERFFPSKNINILTLKMGRSLKKKTFEQRARNREDRFYSYFKEGFQISLDPKNLGGFPPFSKLLEKVRKFSLMGLCSGEGDMLGLGIFLGFKKNRDLRIYTPVEHPSKIRYIILGRLRITSRGKQL